MPMLDFLAGWHTEYDRGQFGIDGRLSALEANP